MTTVNMHDAKTRLSALVEAIASGAEHEIVIARNGVPAAKIVGLGAHGVDASMRIGIAEGRYVMPDTFDDLNDEIADLFEGAKD